MPQPGVAWLTSAIKRRGSSCGGLPSSICFLKTPLLCCFFFPCCYPCRACPWQSEEEKEKVLRHVWQSLHTAAGEIFSPFGFQANCMQMWPSVKLPSLLQFGTVCSVFIHVTKWWCSTSRLRRFTGQRVFTMRELHISAGCCSETIKLCSVMLIYPPFVNVKHCKKKTKTLMLVY